MNNSNSDVLLQDYYRAMNSRMRSGKLHRKFKTDNLKFYNKQIFRDINFAGKKVIDIGGGDGTFSFYAHCMGAASVLCMEPETDGCTDGVNKSFMTFQNRLGANNVSLVTTTLQDYEFCEQKFDIILLHNSINHIDEHACSTLHIDSLSRQKYVEICMKIADIASTEASLIICDCSSSNAYAKLDLKNPFMPAIDWRKHQPPETWAELFASAGFVLQRIEWTSFNSLRSLGKIMLGNRLASFFLGSHFCLVMSKPKRHYERLMMSS